MLAYVIIEDTRGPFTEEDKRSEPLCFLDEEDIHDIVNVFKIYILTDEPLGRDVHLFSQIVKEAVSKRSIKS